MASKTNTRLRELKGSGFEIAKGQPDIRGWDVREPGRRKIGTVRELIFDIKAHKVRYAVIDVLDVKELDLEKRSVLVPIGLCELDAHDNDVFLHTVRPWQLRGLPRYHRDTLGAKAEADISEVFGREYTSAGDLEEADMDDSFYEHKHFEQHDRPKA